MQLLSVNLQPHEQRASFSIGGSGEPGQTFSQACVTTQDLIDTLCRSTLSLPHRQIRLTGPWLVQTSLHLIDDRSHGLHRRMSHLQLDSLTF